jgi:hypothetical protein
MDCGGLRDDAVEVEQHAIDACSREGKTRLELIFGMCRCRLHAAFLRMPWMMLDRQLQLPLQRFVKIISRSGPDDVAHFCGQP